MKDKKNRSISRCGLNSNSGTKEEIINLLTTPINRAFYSFFSLFFHTFREWKDEKYAASVLDIQKEFASLQR